MNFVNSKQKTNNNYKQNIFSTIPIPIKNNELFSSFSTFNIDDAQKQSLFKRQTPLCRTLLNDNWSNSDKNMEYSYSLTPNFFDPTSHSPPNEFLIKLQSRINDYYKKESNLFNE